MRVLGISAYYHDSAAALVSDGEIFAAAQALTCKVSPVGSPEDAFRCFNGYTGIETLEVGNCLLRKENEDPALKLDYKESFELD